MYISEYHRTHHMSSAHHMPPHTSHVLRISTMGYFFRWVRLMSIPFTGFG